MLALISEYPVPDFSQGNWDTTLFLTPYGIINNHLHKDTSVLWTFYSDISSGNLELSLTKMLLMAAIYIFFQSNILEVPFYFVFFRNRLNPLKTLTHVTAINSLTHPIVFFVIMNLHNTFLSNILLAEGFAILAEAIFFYKFGKFSLGRSLAAATVANLVSWQLAPSINLNLGLESHRDMKQGLAPI